MYDNSTFKTISDYQLSKRDVEINDSSSKVCKRSKSFQNDFQQFIIEAISIANHDLDLKAPNCFNSLNIPYKLVK